MMNNFMKKILEKDDYHCIDQGIELWNNNNEFFIIQEYDVEELESSGDKTQNFFTCEKTNQLISEFEKIQDNKIKKNTSLFVSVKVNNIKEVYERFKNIAMRIEEDEYYFRKYISDKLGSLIKQQEKLTQQELNNIPYKRLFIKQVFQFDKENQI